MKISNKMPGAMQNVDTGRAGKLDGADALLDTRKARKSAAPLEGDSSHVQLSPRAQDILKAKELATPSSGIDEAKVARLQKLIDQGNYKVDAEAIADRLLDEQSKMST